MSKNKILLTIVLILSVFSTVWFFGKIILYILIAAVLSLIAEPVFKLYSKLKINKKLLPNFIASLASIATVYLLFFLLFLIFVPFIIEEAALFSTLSPSQITIALKEPLQLLESKMLYFTGREINISMYVSEKFSHLISMGQFSMLFNRIFSLLGDLLIAFFAITFFSFFIIKDRKLLFDSLLLLIPDNKSEAFIGAAYKIKELLKRYFIGLFIDMTLVALVIFSGLSIFGIKNALIIGIFAGIINIIPYLGPFIAIGFGYLTLISSHLNADFFVVTLPLIYKMTGVYIFCNLCDSFLFQPYIFGKTVKAHPLEIFTVILMAASLGGIGAMIIAVPTYTVFRVVLKLFFSQNKLVSKLTQKL